MTRNGDSVGWRGPAVGRALVLSVLLWPAFSGRVWPQTAAASSPASADLDARRRTLESVQGNLAVSADQKRKIEADIEEIRSDRVRLNAALIETTARVHQAETKADEITERLATTAGSEDAIKHSLESRRGVIAEVLASLQRLGRKPPPAILIRPEDILTTIRTAMMLGAVVPELRSEAESLASDLAELTTLRTSMDNDRDALSNQLRDLNAETARLQGLVDARQKAQADAEASLDTERRHADDLAQQAANLKDLIARLESGDAAARRGADAARSSDDAQRKNAEADPGSVQAKLEAGPFQDPARLAPAVPFGDTKGLLSPPLAGRIVKAYGEADGYGGTEKGVSLAGRAHAVVAASADGWVAFSGPYRTYGKVLIMNVGGGYYTVLAGLDHVDVAIGQFVLAGEPVGTMGDGSVKTAAAIALGAAEPILYVEFRKDGAAIDPSPWWAKAALQKVRG